MAYNGHYYIVINCDNYFYYIGHSNVYSKFLLSDIGNDGVVDFLTVRSSWYDTDHKEIDFITVKHYTIDKEGLTRKLDSPAEKLYFCINGKKCYSCKFPPYLDLEEEF